jgi:NAD(P)-dependent dehydrogenase (short-subunit alcohol dehydrogenase family)
MKIRGQMAIVTGGASGLGAATARELAKEGARVAVLDFNASGAEAITVEIGGIAQQCDVASASSGTAAIEAVCRALGPPRILVNCAGVAPFGRIVSRKGAMELDDFRRVIEVNLIGTFNMMRLFAAKAQAEEPLEDGERGVIVNTASVAAFEGQVGQSAYAASKGGIVSLSLPAAREFASTGIRVAAIAPGTFETPMLATLTDEVRASLASAIPFPRRLGRPEEYAKLARHIVENPMINGEVIRLDAALRMAPR